MFGRKLVDVEVAEWQYDGFAWLIDNYSSGAGLPDSRLFLPIDEDFPARDSQSATQAEHFFQVINPRSDLTKAIYLTLCLKLAALTHLWAVWRWSKHAAN